MTDLSQILLLLPIFLYAETHYRFRYFFSFLRKREPEILADTPYRIEPGKDIPVLVLCKDADQYPCNIRQITITIYQKGLRKSSKKMLTRPQSLKAKWWWTVYLVKSERLRGRVELDVQFYIETPIARRTYHNDNYRTSTRRPLTVFLSDTPLPKLPGMYFGDAHTHSFYTDDQVEYGAPPRASVLLSKAIGLSFSCITDHSYDLDDSTTDYLQNDPSLPKWNSLRNDIKHLNKKNSGYTVLLGEEVTCRNQLGQNVHLLLYGNQHFIPGSGDSAERWAQTRSEHSLIEVLENLKGGIAVAAHPKEHVPRIQQLLLGRGAWHHSDLRNSSLTGMQFLNGDFLDGFSKGKSAWVESLLSGAHVHAIAGNDAHGNFNRFRQIGVPFFRVAEHDRQIFGRMRTCLLLNPPISESSVLTAIARGRLLISDGPVATIQVSNQAGFTAVLGETISGRALKVKVQVKTSREFGTLNKIKLHLGFLGGNQERVVFSARPLGQVMFEQILLIEIAQAAYIRVSVETSSDSAIDALRHLCLTNPIWCLPE